MPHQRQRLGQYGEAAAREYLKNKGYTILCQNWHAGRYGEIDLVAKDKNGLAIIEVKTRRQTAFGYPEEAVNKAKVSKLHFAARAYVLAHPHLAFRPRLEVIAIVIDANNKVVDIKHYRGLDFDSQK